MLRTVSPDRSTLVSASSFGSSWRGSSSGRTEPSSWSSPSPSLSSRGRPTASTEDFSEAPPPPPAAAAHRHRRPAAGRSSPRDGDADGGCRGRCDEQQTGWWHPKAHQHQLVGMSRRPLWGLQSLAPLSRPRRRLSEHPASPHRRLADPVASTQPPGPSCGDVETKSTKKLKQMTTSGGAGKKKRPDGSWDYHGRGRGSHWQAQPTCYLQYHDGLWCCACRRFPRHRFWRERSLEMTNSSGSAPPRRRNQQQAVAHA
jgi:hypothetical protein